MAGLIAGQIDAGAAHAADGLNAIESGGLNSIHNYGDSIDNYIGLGGGATNKWLSKNPCLAQAYVDARIDANRWAAANKDEYIELSKEFVDLADLSMDARTKAYDIYQDVDLFPLDGGMSEKLLKGTVEVEKAAGELKGADAPAQEVWADSSFVNDYLNRNGREDK